MSLYRTILIVFLLPTILVGCISKKNENIVFPPTTQPTEISAMTASPTHNTFPIMSATITVLPQSNGQVTLTPTQRKVKITDPGIYPVFWDFSQSKLYIDSGNNRHENLLKTTIPDQQAIASPNGEKIAFFDKNFLYTIDLKNDEIDKIPQPEHGSVDNWWSGSWSPDGKYFAYAIRTAQIMNNSAIIEEYPNIYIADLTNNRFIQVTDWETVEANPMWSPDGQWLAFLSDHAKIKLSSGSVFVGVDVYYVSMSCLHKFETCQSSVIKQLTNTGEVGDVIKAAWSPDGKRIAFVYVSKNTAYDDLYMVSLDGRMTDISRSPDDDEDAFDWSPFGDNLITRRSNLDGTDLFLFSIQQNSYKRITNSPAMKEGTPYWSPDGKYIAFTQDISGLAEKSVKAYSINTDQIFQLSPNDDHTYGFAFWMTVLPPIQLGTVLQVSPMGANLNLRQEPSTTSRVIEKLTPGDMLKIVDGPKHSQEYTWWKVEINGWQGWVAEVPLWYLPENTRSFDEK